MLVFASIEGLSQAVNCLSAWLLAVPLDQAPAGSAVVPYHSSQVSQEPCVSLRANPNTSGSDHLPGLTCCNLLNHSNPTGLCPEGCSCTCSLHAHSWPLQGEPGAPCGAALGSVGQLQVLVGHGYTAEQSWGCSHTHPAHPAEGKMLLPGNFCQCLPCNKCCPGGLSPPQHPPG